MSYYGVGNHRAWVSAVDPWPEYQGPQLAAPEKKCECGATKALRIPPFKTGYAAYCPVVPTGGAR